MVHNPSLRGRRGATLVEFALVLPVLLLLTLGTMVGALGVFRHQQVAAFAREAARYAVVHGGTYATEQSAALPDDTALFNYIKPLATGFDTSGNNTGNLQVHATYDSATQLPEYIPPGGSTSTATVNQVTVTVTYVWQPEFFLPQMTLRSTTKLLLWY